MKRRLVDAGFVALVVFVWTRGLGAGVTSGGGTPERFAGIAFREVARELGVDFTHAPTRVDARVANIDAQITATGAAVSITDANGDGWPDLYATTNAHGERNALFVNRGDGTFVERAAEAGLADLNHDGVGCSMGSVWADYDRDGREDVFVYKWGRCQLFRNLGDLRFADATPGSGLDAWINSNAATWLDYDKDGWLDLYVTGYFDEQHDLWNLKTTRVMHDSFEFAANGGTNRLFRNRGDGTFEDVTERTGVGSRRWTYAAVSADFDRDGWPDLYLANDYAVEELFLNRGGERFESQTGIGLGTGGAKSGMCATLGNVANDGRLAVFVTNISSDGFTFQGNNLRINEVDRGGPLDDIASGAVADCGWAWGAQFGDLDDDGLQDLVVVNGFISAGPEDYWYEMQKLGGGHGGLIEDAANWPPFGDQSLSGYERTHVLFNVGSRSGRFVEGGAHVGIDDLYDGRAVALGDLDRDGDLDVVVANQKGPLLVYRNETTRARHWIGFDLVGTTSNPSAIGAEVLVEFARGKQRQVVLAASGFAAQNERRLHFGLGAEPGSVQVTVRWPSGRETVLADPALDTAHRIVEP